MEKLPLSELSDGFSSDGDEEGFEFNPELTLLKRAVFNEKAAPEVLPYFQDLIESMLESLHTQEEILEGEELSKEEADILRYYQMDVERVKYLVVSYLRIRLLKIQKFALYLKYHDSEALKNLSEKELAFLEKYVALQNEHMSKCAFSKILLKKGRGENEIWAQLENVAKPNLDKQVFCKVIDQGVGSQTLNGQLVAFEEGDQFIIKYSNIRLLVATGKIMLL